MSSAPGLLFLSGCLWIKKCEQKKLNKCGCFHSDIIMRELHNHYTVCLLYNTLIRVKEKNANYESNEKTLFTASIFLFRERTSVLGLHNDLCTEYSPFPCESLVHFLDFGLAGVSGHSKNFVGIELGRRC